MNLKKYQNPLIIQARKDRSLKNLMEKNTATKAGKKVKKVPPNSPEFIDSSKEEEEGLSQDDKEKKIPPLLGVKEEAQSFLIFRRRVKI